MTRTLAITCAFIMAAGTASVQAKSVDWLTGTNLVFGSGEEQDDGKEQGEEQDDGKGQGEEQDDGKEQGEEQDDKGQGFLVAGSGEEQDEGKEQEDGKEQGEEQDDGKEQGEEQDDKGQQSILVALDDFTGPEAAPRRPGWRSATACYARNGVGRTFQATVRGRLSRRGLNMLQMRAVQSCRYGSAFFLRRTCRPIGCRMLH